MNKQLFLLAIAAMGTFASCTKEDTPAPAPKPTPTPSGPSTPTYGTGDGAVVALLTRTSTSTPIGPVDLDLGTAVAVFGNLATGAYTDAGKITLNGSELTKQSNNSYLYTPGMTNPTGIDLSGSINWSVATPAFTFDAGPSSGRGMPSGGKISGTYTSIDVSKDFILSTTSAITKSDSVYFQVNGASKSLLKRMGPGVNSVTFTAAELSTLGATSGASVTIAPWNHQEKMVSGKLIHVINELALSRTVELK